MRTPRAVALFPLALLLFACVSETTEVSPVNPIPVEELDRWRVEKDGQLVGVLKKLRLEDPETPEIFYVVEHASGQQAGIIDQLGRAYRDDPFSGKRVLVAMASMHEDLRLLLELAERPEVLPWNDDAR